MKILLKKSLSINIILFIVMLISFRAEAQYTSIPDANFEARLEALGYDDISGDGQVPTSLIAGVTQLYAVDKSIVDLTGIEDFTALEELYVRDNAITSLDVSNNLLLEVLECRGNALTDLTLPAVSLLTTLNCRDNFLTSLFLSNSEALISLIASGNNLTYLNVNNNNNTNFISFDVTSNDNLFCILVDDANYSTANWTNVDVQSSFGDITNPCPYTSIPDANFEAALYALGYDDVSNDGQVPTVLIETVTTLDVGNQSISDLTGIEDFTALVDLNCRVNNLTSLDLSNNLLLEYLICRGNNITTLDFSSNPSLKTLNCRENISLTSLDVSNNTALTILNVHTNSLTNLDVSNNTLLTSLLCHTNNLTDLDLTNNIALETLNCHTNNLTSLDLSNKTALTALNCHSNDLSYLNVKNGNNTAFTTFNATNNPNLTCISVDDAAYSNTNWTNIDATTSFSDIYCYTAIPDANFEARLEALGYDDISGDGQVPTALINDVTSLFVIGGSIADLTGIEDFAALTTLNCRDNDIASLDVSNNLFLEDLECRQNLLTNIYLPNTNILTRLHCRNNLLTSLDISNYVALTYLDCRNNSLTYLNVKNGNNTNFTNFEAGDNAALFCIAVDDEAYSSTNWNGGKDAIASFSDYCLYTAIPDINFEAALYALGYDDISSDGQVPTSLIEVITSLDVSSQSITDVTGIVDFRDLSTLNISNNNLPVLDLSNNLTITNLDCSNNSLSNLDLDDNTAITSLDCSNNNLSFLRIQNGNNTNISVFNATSNSQLTCVWVDDTNYSMTNWTNIDPQTNFTDTNLYCRYTAIPDANFEAALDALGYDDMASDGQVPTALIEVITELDVNSQSISDLTGIQDFRDLERLLCHSNNIPTLDVSNNTQLNYLKCNNSNISTLTLGNLVNFQDLIALVNDITAIDFTNLPALDRVNLAFNSLVSVDLSQNPLVTDVRVDGNNLTYLNIQNGNNTAITQFNATGNPDLSCIFIDDLTDDRSAWEKDNGTPYKEDNYCEYTNIPDANFEAALEALGYDDISNDGKIPTELIEVITSLDVSSQSIFDLTGIEDFTALSILDASNNILTTLDLSALANLTSVDLNTNSLTNIDFRNGVNTNITSIELTNNAGLCVLVDNATYSSTNWTSIDGTASYSDTAYCSYTAIADVNFETRLEALGYDDITSDGQVPTTLIEVVTSLDVSRLSISDLTGIEDFNALSILNASNNTITTLDLSTHVNLTSLDLNTNVLTSLDLRNGFNTNITTIDLTNNANLPCVFVDDATYSTTNWTNVDATTAFSLDYLDCGYVEIPDVNFETELIAQGYDTVIDGLVLLSSINTITDLRIDNKGIADLTGIEYFSSLQDLSCKDNSLTTLNLRYNTNLSTLNCARNDLLGLSLDFNTNLSFLNCARNQLSSLSLRNGNNHMHGGFNAINNANLTCITVDNAAHSTANWAGIDSHASFSETYCGYTFVPDPNFEAALGELGLDNISNDAKVPTSLIEIVTSLDVSGLEIEDLTGIEGFTVLSVLNFSNNALTELDITNNVNLTSLDASYNQIESIDTNANLLITSFLVNDNNLNYVNFKNKTLTSVSAFNALNNANLLCVLIDDAAYGVTNFTNIDSHTTFNQNSCELTMIPDSNFENFLFTSGYDNLMGDGQVLTEDINEITTLDVSSLGISDLTGIEDFNALSVLNCSNNSLTILDVTNNINFTSLNASDNQIENLDVTNNINLISLNISNNQIESLDVSTNTNLVNLNTSINDLISLNVNNGNNTSFTGFDSTSNPNLYCVRVDDPIYSATNWTNIDTQTEFSVTDTCYTLVPDLNFESYLESLGYDDISNDGQVPTENIRLVTALDVSGQNITDLTGIQSFKSLLNLDTSDNSINALDVSNLNLETLIVRNNPNLNSLLCNNNAIKAIDLTTNVALTVLNAAENNVSYLNIKNGNNTAITTFDITGNSNLTCVLVDDETYATTNWTNKDVQTNYNEAFCTYIQYEFNNNLEDSIGDYDASYLLNGELDNDLNATYVTAPAGFGVQSDPTEGVRIPVEVTPFLFTDDSVEFEMNFTFTDMGSGEGRKDIFTLRKSANTNASGFTIRTTSISATEYGLRLYWNDNDFIGGGGERVDLGVFTIGENVNMRFIIDRSKREWYIYANNYFNGATFRTVYDLDYLIDEIQNTPIYLGSDYSIELNTGTIEIDDFSVHVPAKPTDVDGLKTALVHMTDHILGNVVLTAEQIESYQLDILSNLRYNYMNARTEVDDYLTAFEANFNPLFEDRVKVKLFNLTSEEVIAFFLQQDIIDNAFTNDNMDNVVGTTFEFSDVFPGPVDPLAPRVTDETVAIDCTYLLDDGYTLMGQDKGVYRPTGYYAAPGELVTITVPIAAATSGIEVVVGTPSRNVYGQDKINRYHRIKTEIEITSEFTKVGNPLGGGIYIKIPANLNLGWLDFTVNGAVKSPYFRMLSDQPVNLAEFQTDMTNAYVNWVDMESDRMMFTIPYDIVDVTDPTDIMTTWNSMWDSFSTAAGRPLEKNRAEYWLVDCGGINNAAGYPEDIEFESYQGTTRNESWNPLRVMDADYIDNYPSTIFHEMGHTMLLPEPPGEAEANIQLCGAPMLVDALGFDYDEMLLVIQGQRHDRDLAAMYWMTAYNFRNNEPMRCDPTMDPDRCFEIAYQIRGAMKWHEIASLYNFETLGQVQKVFYDYWAANGGTSLSNPGEITRDELIRAATEGTGINLTPLLHFWGYIPDAALITEFDSYMPSSAFCERLDYYRSLIPLTQADYLVWHTQLLATTNSDHLARLTDIYDNWEIEDISGQILAQIDYLQALYCDKSLVSPKVYLQGALLNPNTGEENLMRDDLKVANLIPTTSPYADSAICESTVFDVAGDDAIVDWVWVELRDQTDNTIIVDSQSALLQRDGDIVSVDGKSTLYFNLESDNYNIVISHRNHLSIMSNSIINLTSSPTLVDFTDASNQITYGSNAQTINGLPANVVAMWAGDVNNDGIIQYSGAYADSPNILSTVLNDSGNFFNFSTYIINGYTDYDIDMNGTTQYTGATPDTPYILQNILSHPGNFLNFITYGIIEQLPEN